MYEKPIVIEAKESAQYAIIWLHGLGAHGSDFIDAVPHLGLDKADCVRVILPHAAQQPVTINGGWVMPSWYDILAAAPVRKIDQASLQASVQYVHELVAQQVADGIAAENIFIFGFSQGGAVAYKSVFDYPQPLGGLVALSTYIPDVDQFAQDIKSTQQQKHIGVWIGHGSQDDVVPVELGEQAYTCLQDWGYQPLISHYSMQHSLCIEELVDIGVWLNQRM